MCMCVYCEFMSAFTVCIYVKIVKELLRKSADFAKKNSAGKTCYELVCACEYLCVYIYKQNLSKTHKNTWKMCVYIYTYIYIYEKLKNKTKHYSVLSASLCMLNTPRVWI